MTSKQTTPIVIAIAFFVVAVFVFYRIGMKATPGQEPVSVAYTMKDLRGGEAVRSTQVGYRSVLPAELPPRPVTKKDAKKFIGRTVTGPIDRGSILRETDFN